ncbi:MAG: radical SAM protein [Fibrobacteria bacterium]|nr:radical SAM protein [Fibrobacteria bacterium]
MSNSKKDLAFEMSHHPRRFEDFKHIYPVISRRSRGVSIGINLSPDNKCNFNCVYCQVEKNEQQNYSDIRVKDIMTELERVIQSFDTKAVCELPKFEAIPSENKILRDIAISGNGEPTLFKDFNILCQALADFQLSKTQTLPFKLILITNASRLGKPEVLEGIGSLLKENGEIWVKFDSGSERLYKKTARTMVPFEETSKNIIKAGRTYPLVIQSLFFKWKDKAPATTEIEQYCNMLREFLKKGVKINLIQLYTVARKPASKHCTALSETEIEMITQQIATNTGIPVTGVI